MEKFVVYLPDTGEIDQIISPPPSEDAWHHYTTEGKEALVTKRKIDPKVDMVRNKKIAKRPKRQREGKKKSEAWRELRRKRSNLLRRHVDQMNPIRWEEMDEAQRTAWRSYRQALLDLPANTTDPENVEWPEAPE